MRRLNSKLSTDSIEKWRIPYLDIIAVGAIQFFLALLILCYGVYLMVLVSEKNYDLKTGLWTAIIFVTVFKITNPWVKSYCKYLDKNRHKVHKRNIVVAVIFLSTALSIGSLFHSLSCQMILYGGAGGFLSAFIQEHMRSLTAETFKNQQHFFENLDLLVKPLCLILMPHFVLFLANLYSATNSQLILGGISLNIIPFCLLTKNKRYQKTTLCKFQTVERLSIEMTDLNPKTPVLAESSSEDEESDEEEMEINPQPVVEQTQSTSPSTIQDYYQNVGVKILPNIPEENESEEDDDINEISSKRLSRISAILQGLNETEPKDVTLSVNNLYQPDEIVDIIDSKIDEVEEYAEELYQQKNKTRCFSISSNRIYDLMRKKEKTKDFFKEHFIMSFPRTLSKLCFYPALISNSVTTTLAIVIFAAAPYLMLLKNKSQNNAMTLVDATFLLTTIGFSWIFFLAGYPVYNKMSQFKVKMLFIIGLAISALSLFIAQRFSYDNFTLFALTFGLGHGIVAYTEYKIYAHFFGCRNWQDLQAPLEISVGFIVILIYLIIYLSNLEIDVLLSYAYWPYIGVVALWIPTFILEQIVSRMKNIRRYSHEKYPTFTYF